MIEINGKKLNQYQESALHVLLKYGLAEKSDLKVLAQDWQDIKEMMEGKA